MIQILARLFARSDFNLIESSFSRLQREATDKGLRDEERMKGVVKSWCENRKRGLIEGIKMIKQEKQKQVEVANRRKRELIRRMTRNLNRKLAVILKHMAAWNSKSKTSESDQKHTTLCKRLTLKLLLDGMKDSLRRPLSILRRVSSVQSNKTSKKLALLKRVRHACISKQLQALHKLAKECLMKNLAIQENIRKSRKMESATKELVRRVQSKQKQAFDMMAKQATSANLKSLKVQHLMRPLLRMQSSELLRSLMQISKCSTEETLKISKTRSLILSTLKYRQCSKLRIAYQRLAGNNQRIIGLNKRCAKLVGYAEMSLKNQLYGKALQRLKEISNSNRIIRERKSTESLKRLVRCFQYKTKVAWIKLGLNSFSREQATKTEEKVAKLSSTFKRNQVLSQLILSQTCRIQASFANLRRLNQNRIEAEKLKEILRSSKSQSFSKLKFSLNSKLLTAFNHLKFKPLLSDKLYNRSNLKCLAGKLISKRIVETKLKLLIQAIRRLTTHKDLQEARIRVAQVSLNKKKLLLSHLYSSQTSKLRSAVVNLRRTNQIRKVAEVQITRSLRNLNSKCNRNQLQRAFQRLILCSNVTDSRLKVKSLITRKIRLCKIHELRILVSKLTDLQQLSSNLEKLLSWKLQRRGWNEVQTMIKKRDFKLKVEQIQTARGIELISKFLQMKQKSFTIDTYWRIVHRMGISKHTEEIEANKNMKARSQRLVLSRLFATKKFKLEVAWKTLLRNRLNCSRIEKKLLSRFSSSSRNKLHGVFLVLSNRKPTRSTKDGFTETEYSGRLSTKS